MLGNCPDFIKISHIVSKVEKFTFPLAKLLKMKENFRIKVQNFEKKWHLMVLLLAKNSKILFLPNFLKQVVIEIRKMNTPIKNFQSTPLVYQSINLKFLSLSRCFPFWTILSFYAVLRVFGLYSHYDDSISSKKLNAHLAFESRSLLSAFIFLLKQHIS